MLIPDDEGQFEAELRRFVPHAVAPLPAASFGQRRRRWPLAIAAAILAVAGILVWQSREKPQPITAQTNVCRERLTLGQAQDVLVQSPSFESALDALDRATTPVKKSHERGKRSALEALGKDEL